MSEFIKGFIQIVYQLLLLEQTTSYVGEVLTP